MQALVTGGAGFIGSHVVDRLLREGHDVLVVDDLSRGDRRQVATQARLCVQDICAAETALLVEEARPDVIFHLAAQMDVRISVQQPVKDAEVNVLGTLRLVDAAVRAGTKTFIFSSTGGAIYGEQEAFPADESHRCRPESPYGLGKWCAEAYLAYYDRIGTLRAVSLRYGNVYGPRQNPHGEAGVVAIFASKLLRGEPATIYGDGHQTRDYVFVEDVAEANLLALEAADARGPYNIGTGRETSVLALYHELSRAAGTKAQPMFAGTRPGEQQRSAVASERAKRELGWRPRYDLPKGLQATMAWFARHAASPDA
jgi:UDP-glucose 4-epimerase